MTYVRRKLKKILNSSVSFLLGLPSCFQRRSRDFHRGFAPFRPRQPLRARALESSLFKSLPRTQATKKHPTGMFFCCHGEAGI